MQFPVVAQEHLVLAQFVCLDGDPAHPPIELRQPLVLRLLQLLGGDSLRAHALDFLGEGLLTTDRIGSALGLHSEDHQPGVEAELGGLLHADGQLVSIHEAPVQTGTAAFGQHVAQKLDRVMLRAIRARNVVADHE